MDFQRTLDLGVVEVGMVTMRATMYRAKTWVDVLPVESDPVIVAGGQLAGDFVAEQEADPAMAQALARIRKRVGSVASNGKKGSFGIAALRLNAGLSQQQLAQKMETHQPSIARWERAPEQMTFLTIRQMAAALDVNEQAIFDAIEATAPVVDSEVVSAGC